MVQARPIEYARDIAAYTVQAECSPYLTELAQTLMQQQETTSLQQEQLNAAQSVQTRLSPFSEAVTAAVMICSRLGSPSGNLRGMHKPKKSGKAWGKQALSGMPSIPSVQPKGLFATPAQ